MEVDCGHVLDAGSGGAVPPSGLPQIGEPARSTPSRYEAFSQGVAAFPHTNATQGVSEYDKVEDGAGMLMAYGMTQEDVIYIGFLSS